jgi:hypothetical protein
MICGCKLISHLCYHLVLLRCFRQHPRFIDVVGEGLLNVDVLAALHGGHCGYSMCMICGRDRNSIDTLALFVEHLAEILVILCVGKILFRVNCHAIIDVTQESDFCLAVFRKPRKITFTFSAYAYPGDVQCIAGCYITFASQYIPRHNSYSCCGKSGIFNKIPPGK